MDDPLAGPVTTLTSGTFVAGISGSDLSGYYTDAAGTRHGFIYNGTSYTTLDDPNAGTGSGHGTEVSGIDGNNVVGSYSISGTDLHGFIYNGTTFTDLPNDPASTSNVMVPTAISGGNIVGFLGGNTSFLYNGLTYTPIADPLGVNGTLAYGISGDRVVGYYLDASDKSHGFLFDGTTYTTIDAPSVPGSNAGTMLWGISNDMIFGTGPSGGFVATIPEPSSCLLAVVGSLALLLIRKRALRA